MDTTKPIEWQRIKDGWLGFQGAQLLCIVEKIEDLPVEGWTPSFLRNVYMNAEAAKVVAEKELAAESRCEAEDARPRTDLQTMAIPVLKGVLGFLEAGQPAHVEPTPLDVKPK